MNISKSYYSGADILLGLCTLALCSALFHLAEADAFIGIARERFSLLFDLPVAVFLFLHTVRLSFGEKGEIAMARRKRLLLYQGLILGAIGLFQCFFFDSSFLLLMGLILLFLSLIITLNTTFILLLFLGAFFVSHYMQFTEKPWLVQGSSSAWMNSAGIILSRGYYSIFPWVTFALAGILFGRIKLSIMTVIGIPIALVSWLIAFFVEGQLKKLFTYSENPQLFDETLMGPNFFLPSFILIAVPTGMLLWYSASVLNSNSKWNPLGLLGYMKYSVLLLAGIYQIFIAMFLPGDMGTLQLFFMQSAFWLVVFPFSYFWRKHFKLGPVEQVFKRLY
jgi:uncharacterized membrane protein YeiB